MEAETLWQRLWRWTKRYLLAPLPAFIVIIVALVLIGLGVKNIQIGGLLGKLFGHKPPEGKKAVDVANTIPEDRVDSSGKVIQPGTPDEKGLTQAVVVPIEPPGMFSNPDKVVIQHPEDGKKVVVDLPTGVKAKDVDKVVVVNPKIVAVTVKDKSKVPAKKVDDLLKKYDK